MWDVSMVLEDVPGTLSAMGRALGDAGVSVEGGGAWVVNGVGAAHFLVEDANLAREALRTSGIQVVSVREVVTVRLRQDVPGQLGALTARMGSAGVNIEVLYSDHHHRLILVVDKPKLARQVAAAWDQGPV